MLRLRSPMLGNQFNEIDLFPQKHRRCSSAPKTRTKSGIKRCADLENAPITHSAQRRLNLLDISWKTTILPVLGYFASERGSAP